MTMWIVRVVMPYDDELDFEYFRSDAQLNFDLGFKNEVDVRKSVERVKDADVVKGRWGVGVRFKDGIIEEEACRIKKSPNWNK